MRAVVASAQRDGAIIREMTPVTGLRREGDGWLVRTESGEERFDMVINAAGPWMNALLKANHIRSRYRLTLVRGSHLVLKRRVSDVGILLQSVSDRRVFFVLPWKGTTLVGTTEVLQRGALDDVHASQEEVDYLISRFNRYIREPITAADVASTFAGVRPLVGRSSNPSAIGREYRIQRSGNLINIFGGKMTTFMSLSRKVAMRVDNYFGQPRDGARGAFRDIRRPGEITTEAQRTQRPLCLCGEKMSHYVTDLDGERKPRKPPDRELDAIEVRILGSLAEKQMATPEYYPLTLNALVAACNQKSNREPVMELAESEVQSALDRLQSEKLVWKVMGGRAVRWEHNLDATLQLDRPSKAILTLLFLRGVQTPGELRGRSDRLHAFESIAEVEETLQRLDPLVREIVRGPGQKESRWTHVLSGVPAIPPAAAEDAMPTESVSTRLKRLEDRVAMLIEELHSFKAKLGE